MLEIKKTPDGKVLARRKDGHPLTPEDREQAKVIALKIGLVITPFLEKSCACNAIEFTLCAIPCIESVVLSGVSV